MKAKIRPVLLLICFTLLLNLVTQAVLSLFRIQESGVLDQINDDEAKVFLQDLEIENQNGSHYEIGDQAVMEYYMLPRRPVNAYGSFREKLEDAKKFAEETSSRNYLAVENDGSVTFIHFWQAPGSSLRSCYVTGKYIMGKEENEAGKVLAKVANEKDSQFFCGQLCHIKRIYIFTKGSILYSDEYQVYYQTDRGWFARFYYYDEERLKVMECTAVELENLEREFDKKFNDGIHEGRYIWWVDNGRDRWNMFLEFTDYEVKEPVDTALIFKKMDLVVRLAVSVVLTAVTVTVGVIVIKKRGRKKAPPVEA